LRITPSLALAAGLDAVGQLEQVGDQEGVVEDVLADLLLALFDLLGDLDLLLATKQGDRADLLQVHANRVGGVLGKAGRGRRGRRDGLGRALLALLLGPLALFLCDVLAEPGLGQRLDALDVDLAQHRDDAVDLLAPRLGTRHSLAHLIERAAVRLGIIRQLARLGVGTVSLHRRHLLRASGREGQWEVHHSRSRAELGSQRVRGRPRQKGRHCNLSRKQG
jgi:hypothetical protein